MLHACCVDRGDLVDLLLACGAEIEGLETPHIKSHPLYRAVVSGEKEQVRLVLMCCGSISQERKREILGQASLDMLEQA